MTPKDTPTAALAALRQIIAAPLQAAMEAQAASSLAAAELVKRIGFDARQQPVMTDFSYNRPGGEAVQLKVPLLSLLPMNSLRIQEVNVDFNLRISAGARASLAARRTNTQAAYQMHMQVKAVQEELPPGFTDGLAVPVP